MTPKCCEHDNEYDAIRIQGTMQARTPQNRLEIHINNYGEQVLNGKQDILESTHGYSRTTAE